MMLEEIQHPAEPIQRAAATALAHLVRRDQQDSVDHVLCAVQDTYCSKLPVLCLSHSQTSPSPSLSDLLSRIMPLKLNY